MNALTMTNDDEQPEMRDTVIQEIKQREQQSIIRRDKQKLRYCTVQPLFADLESRSRSRRREVRLRLSVLEGAEETLRERASSYSAVIEASDRAVILEG
jgi:hypothetical protein